MSRLTLDIPQLIQTGLMIIIISMGMPGIPGTLLIGLTMTLAQINAPLDAISLILGIYAILDMFETASNCLGEISTTVAVVFTAVNAYINVELHLF